MTKSAIERASWQMTKILSVFLRNPYATNSSGNWGISPHSPRCPLKGAEPQRWWRCKHGTNEVLFIESKRIQVYMYTYIYILYVFIWGCLKSGKVPIYSARIPVLNHLFWGEVGDGWWSSRGFLWISFCSYKHLLWIAKSRHTLPQGTGLDSAHPVKAFRFVERTSLDSSFH